MLRAGRFVGPAVILIYVSWLASIHLHHRLSHGHFAEVGLHTDTLVHDASIGIPGITKMYEGTLANYGLLPAVVERCAYVSDTLTPGEMVAFNIERWDPKANAWSRALEFAKPAFCRPVPLSTMNTRWERSWLWPGQRLSTEEEATGARDIFRKGDKLRFVIVTEVTKGPGGRSAYPTPSFILDEQKLDNETPFRVRH